jgi:predicted HAD superfamily phosphohydrolase YqeG
LAKRLAKHGYNQSKIVPGLQTHESWATTFTLVVDNFAIKIVSKNDAEHTPHKNQKWIYKIKMLQIDQFIVSNLKFIVSQIHLFYLIIKFNFLTKAKNRSKNIKSYK